MDVLLSFSDIPVDNIKIFYRNEVRTSVSGIVIQCYGVQKENDCPYHVTPKCIDNSIKGISV